MTEKTKNGAKKRGISLYLLSGLLILTGILLLLLAWNRTKSILTQKNYEKITETAQIIDHNLNLSIKDSQTSLRNILRYSWMQEAEKTYDETGDADKLRIYLSEFVGVSSEYTVRILVLRDGETVLTDRKEETGDYRFVGISENGTKLCIDSTENQSYLALSASSERFEYLLLFNIGDFFRSVLPSSRFRSDWIVLYNLDSGFVLRNNNKTVEYEMMSAVQMAEKKAGYSEILTAETEKAAREASYQYSNSSGLQNCSISVLPTSLTENGEFGIAVAVNDNELRNSMVGITMILAFSAVILLEGAFILTGEIHNSVNREGTLSTQVETLAKEKEFAEEVMLKQEENMHHQQLEMLGTISAGVSHEFNNMLTPIMANASLLIDKTTDMPDPSLCDSAFAIYEASRRAKELVREITKISRKGMGREVTVFTASKLILDTMLLMNASKLKNIELTYRMDGDGKITGDETQLENVLLNLFLNATHAIGESGGKIEIVTAAQNGKIVISVLDSGTGIPEAILNRIFEPFFTTKEPGKGTGLGLAIAQNTVINHGGTLTASNRPEGGACFTITLPLCDETEREETKE